MGNCKAKSYEYRAHDEAQEESDDMIPAWHEGSILGMSAAYYDAAGLPLVSCSDDKRIAICRGSVTALFSRTSNHTQTAMVFGSGHNNAVNRVAVTRRYVYSVSRDLSLRQVLPLLLVATLLSLSWSLFSCSGRMMLRPCKSSRIFIH